jgi:hypothetical protein
MRAVFVVSEQSLLGLENLRRLQLTTKRTRHVLGKSSYQDEVFGLGERLGIIPLQLSFANIIL